MATFDVEKEPVLQGVDQLYARGERVADLPIHPPISLQDEAFRKAILLDSLQGPKIREQNAGILLRTDMEEPRLVLVGGVSIHGLCDFGLCRGLASVDCDFGRSCSNLKQHIADFGPLQLLAVALQQLTGGSTIAHFQGNANWLSFLSTLRASGQVYRKEIFGICLGLKVNSTNNGLLYSLESADWSSLCLRPWCLRNAISKADNFLCKTCDSIRF